MPGQYRIGTGTNVAVRCWTTLLDTMMPRRESAIRFNTEKSQSWIIAIETFLVGVLVGVLCWRAALHPAVSIGAGLATAIVMSLLLLHVPLVFWLWTFLLSGSAAAASGAIVYNTMGEDTTWSMAAALVAALMVISVHVTSRRHARAEATPNKITRIT
jgi:heme/copper-type cytochrome/quinol oxidase subunit 2